MNQFYSKIIKNFPSQHIKYSFAYGSGVFSQLNNNEAVTKDSKSSSNMIDFVFVVNDSVQFHTDNLKQNRSHYSFLKWLGPKNISKFQDDIPAACYYNTLIPINIDDTNQTQLIKYGVISEKMLIRDLYDWDYLYIGGRLHKPVKIIEQPDSDDKSSEKLDNNSSFNMALQTNLQNALHTALLLLPENFTLEELFICITSLSYMGDLRMVVGENKNKCVNIVKPQVERFIELYKPYIIKECLEEFLLCNFETGQMCQRLDQPTVYHHLNLLPKNLIQTIINLKFKTNQYYDLEEYIYKLTNRSDYKEMVAHSVGTIVRNSSTIQSMKGILTAGLLKTTDYSLRKLKKMIN